MPSLESELWRESLKLTIEGFLELSEKNNANTKYTCEHDYDSVVGPDGKN